MSKFKYFVPTMDNEHMLFKDFDSAKSYSNHIYTKYGYGFQPRIYPV